MLALSIRLSLPINKTSPPHIYFLPCFMMGDRVHQRLGLPYGMCEIRVGEGVTARMHHSRHSGGSSSMVCRSMKPPVASQ